MDKKEYIISIRIDETMKEAIIKHANNERRSLSQYIYLLIEDALLNKGELLKPKFIIEQQILKHIKITEGSLLKKQWSFYFCNSDIKEKNILRKKDIQKKERKYNKKKKSIKEKINQRLK